MQLINYLSTIAVPFTILFIVIYGLMEKNKVYDTFLEGAKEGLEIVIKIFPTLIGIFLAVGALRSSGILDFIINLIRPLINLLKIPAEIMPLAMLRPISGSASMAVATDIIAKYGVDSTLRINRIYNYGINRNNVLYNCSLYKCCRSKKNTFCFNCSFNGRHSWNACVCCNLSFYVVIFLLTSGKKYSNIIVSSIEEIMN